MSALKESSMLRTEEEWELIELYADVLIEIYGNDLAKIKKVVSESVAKSRKKMKEEEQKNDEGK